MRWLLLLLSCAAQLAAAATISGRVVAVADGDTLTVLDGAKRQHKIRLAEIDAPEKKQSFGAKSRQSLAELCFEKPAMIEAAQRDRYGRSVGRVSCAGIDANAEQVRRGMAWVYARYTPRDSPLHAMQANARSRHLGLWVEDRPTPPWEWRAVRRAAPAR